MIINPPSFRRPRNRDQHSQLKLATARVRRGGSYHIEPLENRVLLSFSTLASFTGANGANPFGPLVADSSGNLYGVTFNGGANSDGTIFELAKGASTITVLHSFTGTDGQNPDDGSPLLIDSNGNLYGTTFGGGTNGEGSIFEYNTTSSTFTSLYSFNNPADGTITAQPYAGLAMDSSGNLWGTTKNGGNMGHGSIFELASTGPGTFATTDTLIYSFTGNADGKNPYGGLIEDSSGDFFGVCRAGGADTDGTIWELASGASTVTTLYTFTDGNDGREPDDSLIMDSSGNLYGTAQQGGSSNRGSLFELAKSGSTYSTTLTTLASFAGSTTGQYPWGSPVMDSQGDFFGVTEQGGVNTDGIVWEVAHGSSTVTIMHSFAGSDGSNPYGGLYMDGLGNLFGTTEAGGSSSDGSIYELSSTTALNFAANIPNSGIGTLASISVDVKDQYGNIETGFNSNVTLAVATGPGTLTGTTTVAAVNGVATFTNVALGTAGTYTLSANDGTDPIATSNSFTISSSPAAKVAFHTQPSTVTAGVAESPAVVVYVEDSSGNLETSDTSNVTLAINTGPGAISGTTTVAAVGGVATFSNIKFNTSGSYTLTASDASLTTATSNSFTVNPAAASKLAYSVQPSNASTGVAISPAIVVDVEDAFGNIVTGNSSNVTLSTNTGPGAVSGTATVAASAGVATFNNIILNTAGTYTLAAKDGALTQANSSSFTVSSIPPNKVVYSVQPSNVTAGVVDSPSIVVDLEDPSNNLLTSDNSNVTLSVASGPGSIGGTTTVAASGGVATFSNITFNTAGTYTLTASDGSYTPATSSSFTVSPAAATQVVYGQQPTTVSAGATITPSVTVKVEDQFGNVETSDSSNVTLSVHSGPGSLGGTTTVAASSGVATFSNLSITTAGNYTLTASDGSLTSANSSSFTVNPAAASKVVYSVQPSNVVAGSAISPSIVVDVEDAFGNIVTGNSSNVTLTAASGPGSLSGTTTVAASSGVATFSNVKINTPGTYTITASDGSLTSATSNSITVSAGAASKVVYSVQPSTVTAGVAISPSIVVDVEDSLGNIITSDSSNVTLAVATGPGSATGTLTVAASSGVATFSNVLLNTAGSYTLSATDGSLTSATSSSFTVNPAAASKLVYTTQPSTVTAGVAISPAMVVKVEDQFGNVVTGNTSNVTLAVATGPGSLSGTTTVAASAGVATFSAAKLNTAGTYTLTATDGSLTPATSSSFTVNPAAASKVVYSVQPSTVIAGDVISPAIVVDVEDAFGNIVTGNSSNVTLSKASGPGNIGGTTTVAASSGVATFNNITLSSAGTYTLAAKDGALTSATSNSFVVNPVPTFKLAFAQQPTNITAGGTISPAVTVDVEDSSGNILTSNTSNVTISLASGTGSLGGTLTVAAVAGVATFNNLSLTAAGTDTLGAADVGFASATSSAFTVAPAAATKVVYAQQPTTSTIDTDISPAMTVDVEDQYGNIVTGDTSNVTLSVATGPGAISGTTTVAAVAGVATFAAVKLDTPGSYTLTAADGSLTSATSSSFTVNAAPASKLVYTVEPSDVIINAAISPSIVVDVEDQFGNIITTNTSSITLSKASGPGTLGGTLTMAAVNGVATFNNVKLNATGTYTLAAKDGSLTSATSSSFVVNPVPTFKLAYAQQPTNITAGGTISPAVVVDVEDSSGNILTSNTSDVTLTIASGTGSLGGTLTVAAVAGVATFNNLSLTTAGNYTINAADVGFTSAVSNSFTVAPAAATHLAFTQQPSNSVINTDIHPAVAVAVEDQYGNVVTSDNSNITMTLASGSGTLGGTLTVAATSGVATFSDLTLDTVATDTLSAADGSLTGATSNSFNVTLRPPVTQLAVVDQTTTPQPDGTVSMNVVVAAEDDNGNVVTTDNSTVTTNVLSHPSNGSLAGSLTAPVTNGYATFNFTLLGVRGTYALSFADGIATQAVAPRVSLRYIPFKFQWWYSADVLTGASTSITIFGATPPIPNSAVPSIPTPSLAEPIVAAFTALPTTNTGNNASVLTTPSSALNKSPSLLD
jgi:uncharacterized repeat protein (TIGR03803 family)